MIVLNFTAEVVEREWDPEDYSTNKDVVFKVHGIEIWRTRAEWQRYDDDTMTDAIEKFAGRLRDILLTQ